MQSSVAVNPRVISGGLSSGYQVARIVPITLNMSPQPRLTNNLALEQGEWQASNPDYDYDDKMILKGNTDGEHAGAGALDSAHGLTKTKAELQTQSTYEAIGWKFGNNAANPWQMRGGYPVLYWQ